VGNTLMRPGSRVSKENTATIISTTGQRGSIWVPERILQSQYSSCADNDRSFVRQVEDQTNENHQISATVFCDLSVQ